MQRPCDSCNRSLWRAAEQGHKGCLDALVKEGASEEDKSEAFCKSTLSKNLKCAEFLLDTGIDVNFKSYIIGATPLICAASTDQYSLIQKLISAGASVNAKCKIGETPLIKVVNIGSGKNIELLLEKGANVNSFDFFGRNALCHAACRGNDIVLQLLLSGGADVNAMNPYNKESGLKVIIPAGFEVCNKIHPQAVVDVNTTTLTWAAYGGYEKCVKLLLEAGANVKDSPQALIVSKYLGYQGCMKLLLEAGADVNAVNTDSQSPLMFAAINNRPESVKLLLQAGAEVRLTDKVGRSALQCCVIKHVHGGKSEVVTEIVGLLHAAGERGKEGISEIPLHMLVTRPGPLHRLIGMERKRLIGVLDDSLPIEPNIDPDQLSAILNDSLPIQPSIDKDQLSAIVRQYLQDDEPNLRLMHICRRAIREHLLQMSRVNLFVRVPHLGLPSLLTDFLLYDVSFESP